MSKFSLKKYNKVKWKKTKTENNKKREIKM